MTDQPTQDSTINPYNNCLLFQVAGYLNEELVLLNAESTAIYDRIQWLINNGYLNPATPQGQELLNFIGTELKNSDLSKAMIAKVEEQAMLAAMSVGDNIMKYEIGGKTIAQYLATGRDITVGATRLVQMLTSFPIFMVGVIKYSLDHLKVLCDKELAYGREALRLSNELRAKLSVTFGSDYSEKFRRRVTMARDALLATQRPTTTVLAELATEQGVNQQNLERIRSNLYVAKASLIQDKAAAMADSRVTGLDNFWENVSSDIVGNAGAAWSEFSTSLVSSAQLTIDIEKDFWNNYKSLAWNHIQIRNAIAGIKTTCSIILQASNFTNSNLNPTGFTNTLRDMYITKLYEMKTDIDAIIAEMNDFLDRDSDGVTLTEQYPYWVGKLALYTSSVVNTGFDLAGGWIDSGDDFKQDYATLRELRELIGGREGLENTDPTLYRAGHASFFGILNSIHVGFPKALRGKGSLESAQQQLNRDIAEYFEWINKVKALTTVTFNNFEDLKDIITALNALGMTAVTKSIQEGNIAGIIQSSNFGAGALIDLVIDCIIKKKQEADETASAQSNKDSQIYEKLLNTLKRLKLKGDCKKHEVSALKEQLELTKGNISKLNGARKDLEKLLMASVTAGVAISSGNTAEAAGSLALVSAMTEPEN